MDQSAAQKIALVADDSQSSRDLLRYVLTYMGFYVLEAADGLVALRLLSAIMADVIILDLDMPRCDGYTAASEIRKLRRYAHTPIVALSAGISSHDHFNRSGFTVFLEKPVSPARLRLCFASLQQQGHWPAPSPNAAVN